MKIRRRFVLLIIIILIIILSNYAFVFAKYISNSFWDYYLKSKKFYFTSDYLAIDPINNVDNLWDGNAVSFNLKNNINQTAITESNIDYQVTCNLLGAVADLATCQLNDTTSNQITGTITEKYACINSKGDSTDVSLLYQAACQSGGYSWEKRPAFNNLFFKVVSNNQQTINDANVEIVAVSTSPYHQTIKGYFSLHYSPLLSNDVILTYKNYQDYGRLIITNPGNQSQCLNIAWDSSKLSIDNSSINFIDYTVDENDSINQIKLNILANSNQSYLFYSKNPNLTYNQDDFTLSNTTGC